jgi:uncharacterized protein YndB with AHSA1/START domain
MATVTVHTKATPAEVWAVLADGWTYSQWVVGTSHMRAVDENWPAVGSRLHHSVGVWPALIKDHSEIKASEPNSRLLMTARGWPVGEAEVELLLVPSSGGTEVSIIEVPTGGAGHLLRNPVGEALIYRRNVETMARLVALAERRTEPVED